MTRIAPLLLTLLLALCGQALADEVAADALLPPPAAMQAAQIVILGEIHDNPDHHETQAALVAALAPAALVFEMLTPAQAKASLGVDRLNATAMETALAWDGSGWPDYTLYHPIFAASGPARIYGAALPREDVRRAMVDGAAAVFGDEAPRFGLSDPLAADEQAAREADQMAAHCNALPPEMLPGMVDAQRLRDAAFARTALAALAETGGPVVVITGSGHADIQRGIPAALATAAPDVSVFSLGQIEGRPDTTPPFDQWIITDPRARADPCESFTKPAP
ncbi:hypothetical protein EGN72_11305 [Pseudorhodobacter sp. E13]|uniref:ChaN family lipoprotein n=1 Tax=Pseudorhodobacter sp. E13 TaxID=2487931 RepID=UPI000F8E6014|nr:ChaN family lipoprotein [Pseudorhodobacter sp. E13]RUS59884.1 hypothetical protein EGN72_11305 [Pseudorhodobacter sp. E13]